MKVHEATSGQKQIWLPETCLLLHKVDKDTYIYGNQKHHAATYESTRRYLGIKKNRCGYHKHVYCYIKCIKILIYNIWLPTRNINAATYEST